MKRIAICTALVMVVFGIVASSAFAGHPNPPGCKNPEPKIHNPNCGGGGGHGHKGHHGHGSGGGGNGGGQGSGSSGSPEAAPAEANEEGSIALCAPMPELRADGSIGRYFQVAPDAVDDLMTSYGFTPAVYVQGHGTACSISDTHVNPANYHLVVGYLADNNGDLFTVALAQSEGGDSAIYAYYALN